MMRPALKKMIAAAVVLAAMGSSSCAPRPTPYQPAAQGTGGYGYGEQQLEANRFRITFSGNSDTPRPAVENALLYRAAEVTKQRGYDYFIVVGQDTEPSTRYWSTFDNFGGFGGWGYGHGVGLGVGVGSGSSVPVTHYTAYADVVLMKGTKPSNEPRAYSAEDILKTVGPTLIH